MTTAIKAASTEPIQIAVDSLTKILTLFRKEDKLRANRGAEDSLDGIFDHDVISSNLRRLDQLY